ASAASRTAAARAGAATCAGASRAGRDAGLVDTAVRAATGATGAAVGDDHRTRRDSGRAPEHEVTVRHRLVDADAGQHLRGGGVELQAVEVVVVLLGDVVVLAPLGHVAVEDEDDLVVGGHVVEVVGHGDHGRVGRRVGVGHRHLDRRRALGA